MKQRARRGDLPLPSAAVLIRADLLDPEVLAESARRNFDVYGFYGISVFAESADMSFIELAATRLAAAEWLVLFTAGALTSSGLELWDTGMAPHFDLVHAELTELVARMLATSHRVIQNPRHVRGGDH